MKRLLLLIPVLILASDFTTTYPGDTAVLIRENEMGNFIRMDTLCVLKTIDNGTVTDILTCDKSRKHIHNGKEFLLWK